MSKLDILRPHRLLINRSLRKASEELRLHIDEYRESYNAQYQNNIEDLEIARKKLNTEFEQAQNEVLETLSSDVEAMQAIGETIASYITTFFDRQLTYKKKDINRLQKRIVDEYVAFLSDQMNEIGSEIALLQTRIDLLSQKADVADVVTLMQLCGSALPVEENCGAKQLLELVNNRLRMTSEDDRITRSSLFHVKTILEERVSFLSEIQYFKWVIEQKIQISKELRTCRDEQIRFQSNHQSESEDLQNEIIEYSAVLVDKAKTIRFYWAKPIVYIGAELEDSYGRINELKEDVERCSEKIDALKRDIDYVQQSIDRMKEEKSSDSNRWDRLQKERRSLIDEKNQWISRRKDANSEIASLFSIINALKEKRRSWNAKRVSIQDLLKRNGARLLEISDNNQPDDSAYADIRLKELEQIEEEGRKIAEDVYQIEHHALAEKRDHISKERDAKLSEVDKRLQEAKTELEKTVKELEAAKQLAQKDIQKRIKDLEEKLSDQQRDLLHAKKELQNAQAADTRFALMRLLSDTSEIIKAKAVIASWQNRIKTTETEIALLRKQAASGLFSEVPGVIDAQKAVDSARAKVKQITFELDSTQQLYDRLIADCEEKLQALKLRPNRPTLEERSEMRKIRTWQTSQAKRIKNEGSNNDER